MQQLWQNLFNIFVKNGGFAQQFCQNRAITLSKTLVLGLFWRNNFVTLQYESGLFLLVGNKKGHLLSWLEDDLELIINLSVWIYARRIRKPRGVATEIVPVNCCISTSVRTIFNKSRIGRIPSSSGRNNNTPPWLPGG